MSKLAASPTLRRRGRRGRLSLSFVVLVALDVLALAGVVVVRAPDGGLFLLIFLSEVVTDCGSCCSGCSCSCSSYCCSPFLFLSFLFLFLFLPLYFVLTMLMSWSTLPTV